MSFLGLPSGGSASFASSVADTLAVAPRTVWWVYGGSPDGGTTPNAITQTSINALKAAGVPETNIRWLYEVELSIADLTSGTTIDVVILTDINTFLITALDSTALIDNIILIANGVWPFSGANGTAIDSALSPLVAGGGTLAHDGNGYAKITTIVDTDGSIFYLPPEFVRGAVQTGRFKFKAPTTTELTAGNILYMLLLDSAAKVAPFSGGVTAANTKLHVQISNNSGVIQLIFRYFDNADLGKGYNFSSNTWVDQASEVLLNLTPGTEYWLSLITSATGWKFQLRNAADDTMLEDTPEVAWSATTALTNKQWLLIGDPFTQFFHGTIYINEASSF